MTELSAPQEIWLRLFEQFIRRGVRDLHDLMSLNGITHVLMRTIPAEEAQSFLPQLTTTCAVWHQHGQPDGPRCAEHQLLDSTVVIFMGDEGSAVGICGDCTDCDHVIDAALWIAQGGDFYDMDNLRGLCHAHHSRRTAREQGFAQGKGAE